MYSANLQNKEMSYQLYCDIIDDLLSPVDISLDLYVRFELHQSKIVFLRNLYRQAFLCINSPASDKSFVEGDLIKIYTAIEVTNNFLRDIVLEMVNNSMQKAQPLAL